jgi:hypothetical protein
MKELEKSIKLIEKYNKMDFYEFTKLVEKHIGRQIPKNEKESFKFTGLSNIDFFKLYI